MIFEVNRCRITLEIVCLGKGWMVSDQGRDGPISKAGEEHKLYIQDA